MERKPRTKDIVLILSSTASRCASGLGSWPLLFVALVPTRTFGQTMLVCYCNLVSGGGSQQGLVGGLQIHHCHHGTSKTPSSTHPVSSTPPRGGGGGGGLQPVLMRPSPQLSVKTWGGWAVGGRGVGGSARGGGAGGCGGGGGEGVGTRPWWLALLACGGAYWPLAFVPSAMTMGGGGDWRFGQGGGGSQGGGGGCARPTTTTCMPPGGMCVWEFGGMEGCM